MSEFTSKVVKLRINSVHLHLWDQIMRGEEVTLTLKHSGYRDGTEAELIVGEKK